jgi:hypothetical protein
MQFAVNPTVDEDASFSNLTDELYNARALLCPGEHIDCTVPSAGSSHVIEEHQLVRLRVQVTSAPRNLKQRTSFRRLPSWATDTNIDCTVAWDLALLGSRL